MSLILYIVPFSLFFNDSVINFFLLSPLSRGKSRTSNTVIKVVLLTEWFSCSFMLLFLIRGQPGFAVTSEPPL